VRSKILVGVYRKYSGRKTKERTRDHRPPEHPSSGPGSVVHRGPPIPLLITRSDVCCAPGKGFVDRVSDSSHLSFRTNSVELSSANSERIMPRDLLHPSPEEEARTHKLKRLVQSPNSFFMDIKCPGCFQITTVFSHAQTVVLCQGCNIHLCEPTGGKARLTEGCSYRKKVD
jgi:small subunit ribosomal protein S27e